MGEGSPGERMSQAARDVQHQVDPDATFFEAARLAVVNIEGGDAASLAIVRRRRRLSVGGAAAMASTADTPQHELGEGPCLDTVWREPVRELRRPARRSALADLGTQGQRRHGRPKRVVAASLFVHPKGRGRPSTG